MQSDETVVGEPLERETIRAADDGVLVTCHATHCDWQGLFPSGQQALDAVGTHWERCNQQGVGYHYGNREYSLVELLDGRRARVIDESELSSTDPRQARADRREPPFPRSTDDVDAIVKRGDEIELNRHPYEAVVYKVAETRSIGMPTWSVIYVKPDVVLEDAGRDDYHWLNESVAQDGNVYCRYGEGEQLLGEPLFDVVGEVEHQADLKRFNGGASA